MKKKSGCISSSIGCLASALVFPFAITLFGWVAFAVGPMGCALPNRCSSSEQSLKAIFSLVILVGGGFGVPIGTGILIGKVIQNTVIDRNTSTEHEENS